MAIDWCQKTQKLLAQKIRPLINLLIICALISGSIPNLIREAYPIYTLGRSAAVYWRIHSLLIPPSTGNLKQLKELHLNIGQLSGSLDFGISNDWVKWSLKPPSTGDYALYLYDPFHSITISNNPIYTRARTVGSLKYYLPFQSNYSIHVSRTGYNYDQVGNRAVRNLPQNTIPHQQPYEPLTNREMEVYLGLVEGKSNEEIALELGIKEKTVEAHTKKIFEKTNVCSRVGATTFAFKYGLIDINSVNIRKRYREKPP